MLRKLPVSFLGEGVAAMPHPYPTKILQKSSGSKELISKCFNISAQASSQFTELGQSMEQVEQDIQGVSELMLEASTMA
jgi:hypothetical protein